MSSKKVMSHDPLAGIDEEVAGDVSPVAEQPPAETAVSAGEAVLELPDSLTIAEVGDFHAELLTRLVEDGSVTINGDAVEVIDGAGVQLLAAFVKELIGKSSVVTWQAVSDPLQRAADQVGLAGLLGIEKAPEAA